MSRIHILHENPAWLPPLAEAFDRIGASWTEWFLHEGAFDLAAPPPDGVFYNRMSASSHTRDHRFSAELTAAVLAWLTRWGRRVVNGPGESKHANIGISLPGTFEEPKAPVYVDGKLFVTLKGERIVPEFLAILEEYVAKTYPTSPERKTGRAPIEVG